MTEVLSAPWRTWLADNLVRGVDRTELLALLAEHGVPEGEARRCMGEIEASPVFSVARQHAVRAERAELVLRLVRTRSRIESVERRLDPTPAELFAGPWASGTPFVITDLVTRWPAFTRWSPAYFRDRFGDALIEASLERDRDDRYDIEFARHARAITMADFVELVLARPHSNDAYLIANNRNLARPGLAALFDDIEQPPYLDPSRAIGSSALWFGPAGTITPLHHDTSNVLLCQVVGRKRVALIDPCQPELLAHADGVYSRLGADRVRAELEEVRVLEVELQPGEALFIPLGWWHEVHALDVSISIALNNFRRSNACDWYKPGSVRRPAES